MTPEVRGQDIVRHHRVTARSTTPRADAAAWAFPESQLRRAVGKGRHRVRSGRRSAVVGFACEADLIADMDAFFAAKKVPGAERALAAGPRARAVLRRTSSSAREPVTHRWLERKSAGGLPLISPR